MKRKTRQKPGRADVGEKADADLRHREDETLAGDRMRGVHRETDAPAHHDAVHQGDDRFRIGLDPPIELIFLTPKGQLGVMIARAAELVEAPDVSAGAKGPLARAEKDDPVDGAVPLPFVERGRNQPDHGQGQGVQRLGAVEHNDAGAAAALNERLRFWRRRRHAAATSESTASIALATSSIGAMPSTSCRRPRSR